VQRRSLSCEPLLGPVDLGLAVCRQTAPSYRHGLTHTTVHLGGCCARALHAALHWVIVGGESGPGARPMDLAWARSLVAECRAAAVAVFVKQLGRAWSQAACLGAGHGGDPERWPGDLRVRELP
jgi:protein gp37